MGKKYQYLINAEKIIKYYGFLSETSLKKISKKCVRIKLNEYFNDICSGHFEEISYNEMEECVLEEVDNKFNNDLISKIERDYPNLTDEQIDIEMLELERLYKSENKHQIQSIAKLATKELKPKIKDLQKEVEKIKKKYVY